MYAQLRRLFVPAHMALHAARECDRQGVRWPQLGAVQLEGLALALVEDYDLMMYVSELAARCVPYGWTSTDLV